MREELVHIYLSLGNKASAVRLAVLRERPVAENDPLAVREIMVDVQSDLTAASDQAGCSPCARAPHGGRARRLVAGCLDRLVRTFSMREVEDCRDCVDRAWIKRNLRTQVERKLAPLCRRLDGDHSRAHRNGELRG